MINSFLSLVLIVASGLPAHANDRSTYTYDSSGRLRSVSHAGGRASGAVVTIEYDDLGNRYRLISTASSGTGGCGFNVLDATGNSEFSFDTPVQRVGYCSGPVVIRYQRLGQSGILMFNPQDEYKYINNPGGGCGSNQFVITISVESGDAHIERGSATVTVIDNC